MDRQRGDSGTGTFPVSATACRDTEDVTFEVHDPDPKDYNIAASDIFGALPGELLSKAGKYGVLTLNVTGLDKSIKFHQEWADKYNSPEVDVNKSADGSVQLGLQGTAKLRVPSFKVVDGLATPVILLDCTVKGEGTVSTNGLKHDWSLPNGTSDTGWSGNATSEAQLSITLLQGYNQPMGGMFGVKSIDIKSGLTVGVGLSATMSPQTFRMKGTIGVTQVKAPIVFIIYYNNGTVEEKTIEIELGFEEATTSVDFPIPRSLWLP